MFRPVLDQTAVFKLMTSLLISGFLDRRLQILYHASRLVRRLRLHIILEEAPLLVKHGKLLFKRALKVVLRLDALVRVCQASEVFLTKGSK